MLGAIRRAGTLAVSAVSSLCGREAGGEDDDGIRLGNTANLSKRGDGRAKVSSQSDESPSALMKLPFKTRQTIYLMCLSNTDNEGHLLPASLAQPALTRVNRQIRAETLSLYYESNELFLLRLESDVEEGWWSSREMHHRRRHLQLLRGLSALAAAGRLGLVQHLVILCSPQGVRYHVTKQRPRVRPMMGNDSDGDGKGAEWKDENNYELGVVMPDLHWIWEAQTVGWYEDRDLMRWTEIGFATHEVDWNLHHFTGDLLAHPERYGGASREDAKMMSKMATGRIAEVLAIIVGDGGKKGENFVFVDVCDTVIVDAVHNQEQHDSLAEAS